MANRKLRSKTVFEGEEDNIEENNLWTVQIEGEMMMEVEIESREQEVD